LSKTFKDMFDENRDNLFEQVEETLVRQAFEHCDNNQVRTARLLGISRNILRAQLKRFGLLASGKSDELDSVDEEATVLRAAYPG
jgi:sigma-54-specific transcriptional regulator